MAEKMKKSEEDEDKERQSEYNCVNKSIYGLFFNHSLREIINETYDLRESLENARKIRLSITLRTEAKSFRPV